MNEMSINKIRRSLRAHTGRKIRVRAVNGEERTEIARGVIAEIYPSVFVIETENKESICNEKVSFSYCDVLTKEIILSLCS
ncbi:MAG: Veg family protein [Lachnospiraceae bacterium]|nr:Veg family protein [Lachnospiraceae bacterium]